MIFKTIIKLRRSSRFLALYFLLTLVNLKWHYCQGFENVEKLVIPVPIDLSILRGRGSQSLPVVVDLSILSPKESSHPISNNNRQRTQQTPWGLPYHGQSRFNINNNQPDPWYTHNKGLRTNQFDLMPFHGYGRLPYLPPNLNRQKTSPPIEDAYTDYLREQYGSDEDQDYDMEDTDLIEDYHDIYEETDNHIIPEVNKKSSQELVARPNKRSRSNWLPNAKGDYWRLAHQLRRDKGRRKTKRSVRETGHRILARYLMSSKDKTKPVVQKS